MKPTPPPTPFVPAARGPHFPDQTVTPHLVDPESFAEALWDVLQIRMTPNKAWRWRKDGLPFWPIGPRVFRYDIEEGVQWFMRCGKVANNLEASVNRALYLHLARLNQRRGNPFRTVG